MERRRILKRSDGTGNATDAPSKDGGNTTSDSDDTGKQIRQNKEALASRCGATFHRAFLARSHCLEQLLSREIGSLERAVQAGHDVVRMPTTGVSKEVGDAYVARSYGHEQSRFSDVAATMQYELVRRSVDPRD